MPPSAEESHIMAMPSVVAPITEIAQLLALPEDGLRHELLDGEHVVSPSPAYGHQRLVARLFGALLEALGARPDLEALTSPADIVLGPRSLVQPDLFVIRRDPSRPVVSWSDVGIPVLAVEILSPGTAARDRGKKRRIYQRAGVAEYWIVDADARLIERWTPTDVRPEILDATAVWAPDGDMLLSLDLGGLFGPAGTE